MHRLALFLVGFAGLLGIRSVAAQTSPDEAMAQLAAAWSADDAEAVAALFTDDVVLVGGSGDVHDGRAAVDAWRAQQMANTDKLTVETLGGSTHEAVAYQMGRWMLGYGGGAGVVTGTHTFIFRRQDDGTWRIAAMQITDTPD